MKSDDTFNEAVNRMEDVETKMAFINRQGYQFTSDELEDAFHTHFWIALILPIQTDLFHQAITA